MLDQEWTAEEKQRLIELRGEGLSSSQIGLILGKTRNAVIGKANRMGLARLNSNETRIQAVKKKRAGGPHPSRRPPRQGATPPAPPLGPLAQPPAPDHWLTFSQLAERQCRWPEGQGDAVRFCGSYAAGTYCAWHKEQAHQKNHKPRAGGFHLISMAAAKA